MLLNKTQKYFFLVATIIKAFILVVSMSMRFLYLWSKPESLKRSPAYPKIRY